ncbi:hypothetical protein GGI19_001487 [Coemansia pectinata]|uniref:Uncharacterized protein n=1 Tax=Coemansia pectinata TaxID=1052879 RepID=A0A9W8H4N8_9FUNG|nr:hypothetical protein GGI19_001487 [Coemansia pectinata]
MANTLYSDVTFYYNLAIAYATPALFGFAILYYIVYATSNVLSRRQRANNEKAEMLKRREAYVSRLTGQSVAPAPADTQEKGKAKEPTTDSPFVLRPRAPASTSKPFGANTGSITTETPRFSGPTSKRTCMNNTCG